jgi:hypothetical protein
VFVVERRIEVPYEVKVEVPVPQLSRGESVARCRIFLCRIFCESPNFRQKVFSGQWLELIRYLQTIYLKAVSGLKLSGELWAGIHPNIFRQNTYLTILD